MGHLRFLLLWCSVIFALPARGQSAFPEIRLSEIYDRSEIQLEKPPFLVDSNQSVHDTLHLAFTLINDLGADTTVYLYESRSDWVHFKAISQVDSIPGIEEYSGRQYYDKVAYPYVYFPGRAILIQKNGTYTCTLDYFGAAFQGSSGQIYFLSPSNFEQNLENQRDFEDTNNIVTVLFIGALAFGFCFFLFLFIKSRYPLFGWYASFFILPGVIWLHPV